MPATKFTPALALCLLLGTAAAHANIVKLEITRVEPAGPTHERITGKAYGELDPADPKNAVITDIDLAPRNARGKVEYVTTFTLVKPKDMTKASGVLLYTVVNRGGGNAAAHPDGHVTFVSGWQGDVVPTTTNHTIQVPVAKNRDGSSITGPLVLRFTNLTGNTTAADDSARPAFALSAGITRHDEGDPHLGDGRDRNRREERRRHNSQHGMGICGLLDDAISRHAGSRPHLREERLRSCASVRAAIHREGSARARHRARGNARSGIVLQV